ncbi:YgfZ/GcvT domain-containing protein [Altericroceibacterium xinjiangense]|uniref:CAF17-like 4Fe-4S cluster assembly/insertion protein YgfZ n=1 Tax=Altericroceibacterium xinjiangense TaxID=762261 RepID=UPI000F7D883C|nr:folate-binding protein YgfZ [Altericroceibacterium xinjiangense]
MGSERLYSRAVIRVSVEADGEDAADFLQGLVTNDVKGELPCYAGLLSPQGKTLFAFLVWPAGGGDLLIDCEADQADELIKRLTTYRLRRKIAITREDQLGVYWQAQLGDGGAPDPRLADLGQRWIAHVTDEDHPVDDAWLLHRLTLGVPETHAELEGILWLETNAVELNGVSFSKGCYVGQENTARMNWRQKINRRLIVVPLGRSEEARRKTAYPEAGFAVDHLRVSDIAPDMAPGWVDLSPAD